MYLFFSHVLPTATKLNMHCMPIHMTAEDGPVPGEIKRMWQLLIITVTITIMYMIFVH